LGYWQNTASFWGNAAFLVTPSSLKTQLNLSHKDKPGLYGIVHSEGMANGSGGFYMQKST
jgi:hypothetical protein